MRKGEEYRIRATFANAEPRGPSSRSEKVTIEFRARCSHLIRESLWPWNDVTEISRKSQIALL